MKTQDINACKPSILEGIACIIIAIRRMKTQDSNYSWMHRLFVRANRKVKTQDSSVNPLYLNALPI